MAAGRLGLVLPGTAELVFGFRLIAPVHGLRPGVWHAPTEPVVNLMTRAGGGKPSFSALSETVVAVVGEGDLRKLRVYGGLGN